MIILESVRFKIFAVIIQIFLAQSAAAEPIYLWAHHPGKGYVNGKTFSESSAYCQENGGVLASKAQLIAANKNGFSMCVYGWLDTAVAGYVMVGTHSGCGTDGFNGGMKHAENKKFGAYCVGANAPSGATQAAIQGTLNDYTVTPPNSTEHLVVPDASFKPDEYYYLYNKWLKEGRVLTLSADGRLIMAPKGHENPNQMWRIYHQDNGFLRIHNASLGEAKSIDSEIAKPKIAATGNYSGQYWKFTPTSAGWFMISNSYQGPNKVLDSANGGDFPLYLQDSSKNTAGSFWKYIASPPPPRQVTMTTIDTTVEVGNTEWVTTSTAADWKTNTIAADQKYSGKIFDLGINGSHVGIGLIESGADISEITIKGCIKEGMLAIGYNCRGERINMAQVQGLRPYEKIQACEPTGERSIMLRAEQFALETINCDNPEGRKLWSQLNQFFIRREAEFISLMAREKWTGTWSELFEKFSNYILNDSITRTARVAKEPGKYYGYNHAVIIPEKLAALEWFTRAYSDMKAAFFTSAKREYDTWAYEPCGYRENSIVSMHMYGDRPSFPNMSRYRQCDGSKPSSYAPPGILATFDAIYTDGSNIMEFPTNKHFKYQGYLMLQQEVRRTTRASTNKYRIEHFFFNNSELDQIIKSVKDGDSYSTLHGSIVDNWSPDLLKRFIGSNAETEYRRHYGPFSINEYNGLHMEVNQSYQPSSIREFVYWKAVAMIDFSSQFNRYMMLGAVRDTLDISGLEELERRIITRIASGK
tara:strand:+ start:1874 stop:4144 length:2271 start_codon:yes stop_codon:yes gene_type:complete